MRAIVADESLVAYCGLYCGACGAYRRGRCPGCRLNAKASWCRVRACCLEHGLTSCAACQTHVDPKACPSYHTFISRLFGFVFRSNRAAGVERLRRVGPATYAQEMALIRRPSPRR